MTRILLLGLALAAVPPATTEGAENSPVTRARTVLREGAAEKDPGTRAQVAVALSLIAVRDPAAQLLLELARDKDYVVRESAVSSIGELRDRRMASAVRDALNDDVPEVVFAAARALFRLKQPEAKEVLIEVVEKESKAKSSFLRAKLRDTWRRMRTPKSALLFAVQQGAGFIPVPGVGEGVSALSGMLSDPDFSARATALLLLATDMTPDVRRLVEESFLDDEWSMRAAAVQITAMRQERLWRSKLNPLMDDSSVKVRFRAAACYLRLERGAARAPRPKPAPRSAGLQSKPPGL